MYAFIFMWIIWGEQVHPLIGFIWIKMKLLLLGFLHTSPLSLEIYFITFIVIVQIEHDFTMLLFISASFKAGLVWFSAHVDPFDPRHEASLRSIWVIVSRWLPDLGIYC